MLKQVMSNEIAGKTVAAVASSGDSDQVIVFTDGTFLYQKAEEEYGSVSINEPKFTLFSFYTDKAIEAGVFTLEEYDAAVNERKAQREAEIKRQELEQFERLKKKLFGG